MIYFTDILKTFSAKSLVALMVLLSIFSVEQGTAQTCGFLQPTGTPDPLVLSFDAFPDGTRSFDYSQLNAELKPGCTVPVSNLLFWRDDNQAPGSEIVEIGGGGVANIFATCGATTDLNKFEAGDTIIFYSAASGGNIGGTNPTPMNYDSILVVINLVDVTGPTFTTPGDLIVNCLADTLPFTGTISGITAVQDPCSGVKDTLHKDFYVTTGLVGNEVLKIKRYWEVVDSAGNMTSDTQRITIIDDVTPNWADPTLNTTVLQIAGDPTINSTRDSLFWVTGNNELHVYLDINHPNFTNAHNFWINTFEPIAEDSCIGTRDTLSATLVIPDAAFTSDTITYPLCTTLNGVNGIQTRVRKQFTAMDLKGNMLSDANISSDGSFRLFVYAVDGTPPEIIETPFVNSTKIFDTQVLDQNFNDFKDSLNVVVFIDNGMCSVDIDSADIDIIVRDSISKAVVNYSWSVTLGTGTSAPTPPVGFAIGNNAAAGTYEDGTYEILYSYRDSCDNEGTFRILLDVQTVPPIIMQHLDPTKFNGFIPGIGTGTGVGAALTTIDTFILYTALDTCGVMTTGSELTIMAKDTFDLDGIEYKWSILPNLFGVNAKGTSGADTLLSNGDATMYADSLNSIAAFFPVGIHPITFDFRDTSACPNIESVTYVLVVRDTSGVDVDYTPFVSNTKDSIELAASTGECELIVEWIEPSDAAFTDCTGNALQGVSIVRSFVSGPDPAVLSGVQFTANENKGGNISIDARVGTTIIRYVFTDTIGTSDSVDLTITITDIDPPNAVCPAGTQTLNRDPLTCMAILPDYTTVSNDLCALDTVLQSPAEGFVLMNDTTVQLIAIDESGNRDTCEFMVTVAPLAPAPQSVVDTTTQCSELILLSPYAKVNCNDTIYGIPLSGNPIDQITTPPSYAFSGTAGSVTQITWLFDANGTVATRTQKINFDTDTTVPTVTVPNSNVGMVYLDSLGVGTLVAADMGITAIDNCTDSVAISFSLAAVSCTEVDSLITGVTVYAEDDAGNIDSSQIITIQVFDHRAPDFIGIPVDTTLSCGTATPPIPTIQIRDNCTANVDSVLIETVTNRDTFNTRDNEYYNYYVKYIWTAVDDQNNTAKDSIVYTFVDTLGPVIPYNNPLLVGSAADATTCAADVSLDFLGDIIDNCSDTTYIAVDFSPFDGIFIDTTMLDISIPMGSTSIIIRARDVVGNETKDTLVIQVDDMTDPTPRCINSLAVTVNAFGYVVIDSSVINQNSIDNCTAADDLRFNLSRDTFRCADVGGTYTVIMTAIDEAGNSLSCSSQVTVQDFTGSGSFMCPSDVTINCDDSIDPVNTGSPLITDVCQNGVSVDFTDKVVAGSGNICRVIERSWTVADTSGTVTTCLQKINLVDTIAPVLTQTFADTTVMCITDATTADSILVTDNCAESVYVHADVTLLTSGSSVIVRKIWTASDSCQIVKDTQNITINDVLDPVITLPVDTFEFNTADYAPDSCGILIPAINFADYITDCNADLGLTIRHSDPGNDTSAILRKYYPVGTFPMTVTATDVSGNDVTKAFVIKINDTSTPTVVCVENIVISLGQGGTGVLTVNNVFSSATDNCSALTAADAVLSKTSFDCSDLGMNQVDLIVTDAAGNQGVCTVNVEVTNGTNTSIIDIAVGGKNESLAGSADGEAWVVVTGGSGDYSFDWSPGTLPATDTIKNLSAGLYTVVVRDEMSDCRLTDTVRVEAGAPVNFAVENTTGLTGTIVQVPVIVTNFNFVTSFDMKFIIDNPAVAEFILDNAGTGFSLPDFNNDSFDYTDIANGELILGQLLDFTTGTSLPDGSTLFFLNVRLKGNVGQSTTISIGSIANNTAIKTGVIIPGSSPMDLDATGTPGTITIGDANSNVTFGGTVTLVNGTPLENVTVNLTGDMTGTTETDAAGIYSFAVTAGQNATVTPIEDEVITNQLSVADLVAIQKHILRIDTLDSPYKILAADVNGTQTISISDLVEIQAVILNENTSFSGSDSWSFVPANLVFSDEFNPFADNIPNSISTISGSADFIGFKMGDVNLSASTVNFTTGTPATSRDVFRFGIDDQILEAGQVIEIPFKANRFKEMLGYQMTINAPVEWLTFEGVEAGELNVSARNFGLKNVERGMISTVWYEANPLSIEQNATLFTLSFSVNQGGKNLSEILSVNSELVFAEAHAADGEQRNISLAFDKNTVLAGFELMQNKPNPFNAQTTIGFSLPKAAPASIRFFDFSGKMVHQIKGDYAAGYNEVIVQKNSLSGTGVLYYEIETPTNTARKKMIVLE